MGMAASQARYLALVARKSNCEYEGQQINQARLALSNQSANLFNQMLGLSVPVPPSTSDFTKKQYSFSDGTNSAVIENWHQLAQPDSEGYNYVVDYYYNAEEFHGSQKKMTDPQVQFSISSAAVSTDYAEQVSRIQEQLKNIEELKKAYETAQNDYAKYVTDSKKLAFYQDKSSVTKASYAKDGDNYVVNYGDNEQQTYNYNGVDYLVFNGSDSVTYYQNPTTSNYYTMSGLTSEPQIPSMWATGSGPTLTPAYNENSITFSPYSSITDDTLKQAVADAIEALKATDKGENISGENVYYGTDSDGNIIIALKSDIESLTSTSGTGTNTILPIYHVNGSAPEGANWTSTEDAAAKLAELEAAQMTAKSNLDIAESVYGLMNVPEYIGNTKLNALTELSEADQSAIKQIIKDMKEQDVNTNFTKYFNPDTNEYIGGIYSFVINGTTYYTTYDDLAESYMNAQSINDIDSQSKLPYYTAGYITQKVYKQEKAILETDASGRFTSIRLSDDTVKYNLNVETITDDAAYQDAMNQYYYDNAQYDKMVQDINAKTSLIQQQDRTLELRLKQLDTEQNALATEIDAVAKVVKDNIEKSFKTFAD